jgi:hypothetical protein
VRMEREEHHADHHGDHHAGYLDEKGGHVATAPAASHPARPDQYAPIAAAEPEAAAQD